MSKVLAVCRSDEKGVPKDAIPEGVFRVEYGLEGDAHASSATHRQVSLLAMESIEKMREMGADVGPGDFAENLTTEGIGLASLPIGTRLAVGDDIRLEITQIGKECHTGCAIMQQVGTCIMPTEGVFARVLRGGVARPGDAVKLAE